MPKLEPEFTALYVSVLSIYKLVHLLSSYNVKVRCNTLVSSY